jgi:Ni/Co efflux regulator RcnB
MKSKAVACAIMAMSLTLGSSAFAQASTFETQQNTDRNAKAQRSGQVQRSAPAQRNVQQSRPNNQARQPNRPQYQGNANNYARQGERGAGPDQQFYRGGRLPTQYRSRQYVVDDWRGHHLSAPPRGYHWVQTGNDYVLVAIATGVILQLLLNN